MKIIPNSKIPRVGTKFYWLNNKITYKIIADQEDKWRLTNSDNTGVGNIEKHTLKEALDGVHKLYKAKIVY